MQFLDFCPRFWLIMTQMWTLPYSICIIDKRSFCSDLGYYYKCVVSRNPTFECVRCRWWKMHENLQGGVATTGRHQIECFFFRSSSWSKILRRLKITAKDTGSVTHWWSNLSAVSKKLGQRFVVSAPNAFDFFSRCKMLFSSFLSCNFQFPGEAE